MQDPSGFLVSHSSNFTAWGESFCTQFHLRQACQLLPPPSLACIHGDLDFWETPTSPGRMKTCSVKRGRKPGTDHLCPAAPWRTGWGLRARVPGRRCERRNLLQKRTLYFLWCWLGCRLGVKFQGAPAHQFRSSNLQGLPVPQAAFTDEASWGLVLRWLCLPAVFARQTQGAWGPAGEGTTESLH